MSVFRLVNSETKQIDTALANEFAKMPGSITERELDPSRTAYLAFQIAAGLAVTFQWAYARVRDNPEMGRIRVNGHHSSTHLAGLNGTMPSGLIAHIDEYEVMTKDGLPILFRQFDPRKSARTPLDIVGAYANVEDKLASVDRRFLKIACEGIAWYRKTVAKEINVPTSDDRYELAIEPDNLAFYIWANKTVAPKATELKNPHVLAAMWATFPLNAGVASEFWDEAAARVVISNDTTSPAEVLDDWLWAVKSTKQIDASPAQIYQACISAWNAHVEGKPLTRVSANVNKGFLTPKHPA